ncbi:beta-lactamase [Seminavis robusta]|uniref:Beta-lactamase n=1 Tax=Seminavis robusta TaxID=568900 RepID=A0A9N8ENV1_9STRA|nr:beta-lactamase [Seminavis robusta]|eukprot:Sro1550_g281690.1 beta-lactamase (402) ;mRNA; r:7582-8787
MRSMTISVCFVVLSVLPSVWLVDAATSIGSRIADIQKNSCTVGLAAWSVAGNGSLCSYGAAGETIRWSGKKLKVRGDSRHHIGSVTKGMTSTLLAILIENGVIESWNSTLGELLPHDAPGTAYQDVTLRELVSHLSGLPRCFSNWQWLLYRVNPSKDPRVDRKKATQAALQSEPINIPGTEWSYSNWGYIVAGHIAEEFTGMTWEGALATMLFEPLGIQLTFDPILAMTGAPNNGKDAWGHAPYLNTPCDPDFPFYECDYPPVYGPAGLFSGPHAAMARYFAFHLACHRGEHSGLLLSQASCQTLHSPGNASIHPYGYGWTCLENSTGSNDLVCSHGGANGVNIYLVELHINSNRAFAAMINQGADVRGVLPETMDAFVELQGQEDCAAPIPSSVYIDNDH